MKITIGSDHRGFETKKFLMENINEFTWLDEGCCDDTRTDYPVYAKKVCQRILSDEASCGVLLCGSGVGMSVAANRNRGIFAALCWSEKVAKMARQDDGANVLVLPTDFVSPEQAVAIFYAWQNAEFKGGRYQQRLEMIDV